MHLLLVFGFFSPIRKEGFVLVCVFLHFEIYHAGAKNSVPGQVGCKNLVGSIQGSVIPHTDLMRAGRTGAEKHQDRGQSPDVWGCPRAHSELWELERAPR